MNGLASSLRSLRHLAWPTPCGWLLLPALPPVVAAVILSVALGQLWLNWRLQLDAGLFGALEAGQLDLDGVDQTLLQLFGRQAQPRSLDDRIDGTRRLVRRFLLVTAGYWLLLGAAVLCRHLLPGH